MSRANYKIGYSSTTMLLLVVLSIALIMDTSDIYGQNLNKTESSKTVRTFKKIQLSPTFYAEGAAIGDINQDGHADVVAGPYWYEGPDFEIKQTFYEPKTFDPRNYSDNFIVSIEDMDKDGRNDILVVGFPGEAAYWYKNPRQPDQLWSQYLIHKVVDNEAPGFYDLNNDGNLELVFHTNGYLGYATQNSDEPTQPWSFTQISKQHDWGRFKHGLGVGDIDGDGRKDIMTQEGWWQNPGSESQDSLWQYHQVNFGRGGAQMLVYDVNADGYNDVLTSLDAHGWGLAWFEQINMDSGDIEFRRNIIMGDSLNDNPYGVRFSQLHALVMADIDNDGIKDLVTGKRFWAHGPSGDFEPNAPAVVYWFKLIRDETNTVRFIPYLVDDDSGVGVEITTGDLTDNGYPDIVTSNKNGTFVFANQAGK